MEANLEKTILLLYREILMFVPKTEITLPGPIKDFIKEKDIAPIKRKANLPSGVKYQSMTLNDEYEIRNIKNPKGDTVGASYTGLLRGIYTIGDEDKIKNRYEIILALEEYQTSPVLPSFMVIRNGNRLIFGSLADWFRLDDPNFVDDHQGIFKYNIRILLPTIHEILMKKPFDEIIQDPGDDLVVFGPEKLLLLERFNHFDVESQKKCQYIREDILQPTAIEDLIEQIGLEGLESILENQEGELVKKAEAITGEEGGAMRSTVEIAIRKILLAKKEFSKVVISLGCFDLEELGRIMLGLDEYQLEDLEETDWLQVLNHPSLDPALGERLWKKFTKWRFAEDDFPTMELLQQIDFCPINKKAKVAYLVHCTRETSILKILDSGFLGEAGPEAGHGIPTAVGAAYGYGVYTVVHSDKYREKNKDKDVNLVETNYQYGPICFIVSPGLLDRKRGYKKGLKQLEGYQHKNENYFVATAGSVLYPPDDMVEEKVFHGTYGIFRDKIPLEYVEQIWVGRPYVIGYGDHANVERENIAQAERLKTLLRENGHERYAKLIIPLPKRPPQVVFRKGCMI